jgi:F-type H+-transporting ATPase subunit b
MDELGFHLPSLVVYLVNFGLLLVIMYKFAYKRIIKMLDERSERIDDALQEAERVRRETEDQQSQMQRALDENRQAGQQVLQEARKAAERYREDQQARVQVQIGENLERARAEIEAERDAAIELVRVQFADLVVSASERVIRKSLDKRDHERLIDEVLSERGFTEGQR